jgi:glycosyltransferase involved in cell wall biosynthesis
MKNVLLLAFYFPPRNHIASYRAGCFAKFLPENGWLPTVVCDDWPSDRRDYDPHFVGEIPPEVEIHRILNPTLQGFYERFVLRKIAPFFWPQRMPYRWWQKARAQIQTICQSRRFDAVWATCDPLVPWALAEETARTVGIPWVADIRDSFNVQARGSWYKRSINARQERLLSAQADRVVAVTPGIADGLGRAIGKEVTVIYNGFDETLVPKEKPVPTSKFTIVYAGSLVWPHRNPAPLLRAVELILQRKQIPAEQIEIQFYGSDASELERAFPGVQTRLPVKMAARLSHQEILRVLMASSVLLLTSHPHEKGILPAKAFDYLAARRPILAVPDDQGEISHLLRRTGAGIALTDPEDIVRQLMQWHSVWQSGADIVVARNEAEIAKFSRRAQARQLAGVLDEMTAARPKRKN